VIYLKSWKLAWSLAKFELTASPLYLLSLCLFNPLLIFLVVFLVISPVFNDYLQNNDVGFDFIFLILFLLAPAWHRPKRFLMQSVSQNSDLWAAPSLVLQLQLPITKNTLIKSRLLIYFFLSFPAQCLLLLAMYLVTPQLQTMVTPIEYIVFCIIWLSIGVYAGYIMPAGDVGDEINVKSVTIAFLQLNVGTIAILTFFHLVIGYGLVHSTILIAKKYAILSVVGSLALLIAGLYFWSSYMRNRLYKTDYF